ncbi:MJ0042 family finger-like protein [Acidovorax delafieldii 2AN]|uniref:MJ0042 family finger-like protein n=1 Tax=Acidovorax delafieldii 2AN TaxID=573060 RepID=C5T7M4_ACIDE|nr:MJ0042 family finger-like protein [Acidovorax delafieldii 2AN]
MPESVLDVPVAAVPSFLMPGALYAAQPGSDVPWQSIAPSEPKFAPEPEPERRPDSQPEAAHAQPPALQQPSSDMASGDASVPAAPGTTAVDQGMAGYELPFAELRDDQGSGEPLDASVGSESVNTYPPLELPRNEASGTPAQLAAHGDLDIASVSDEALDSVPDAPSGGGSALDGGEQPAASVDSLDAQSPQAVKDAPRERIEDDDGFDEGSDAQELSFVRAAKRKAFWRRPRVRVLVGAVVALLLGLLALQGTLHERNRIAALDPGARVWLEKLCEAFQCTIAPLRQISDVVIDSSSFNKGRGDSYQLAFVIKNRASVPLAMPSMELTLTDAQDQPVVRRILLPQEMAAPAELPALGEWASSVAVVVTTGGARVAGYRLVAFYP